MDPDLQYVHQRFKLTFLLYCTNHAATYMKVIRNKSYLYSKKKIRVTNVKCAKFHKLFEELFSYFELPVGFFNISLVL